MDSSNDDSLFNFISLWSSIQLDKNTSDDSATTLLHNNNLASISNGGVIGSKPGQNGSESFTFKKEFKSLFTNNPDSNELSSTGNSDKSLSSFGSESNDSTGDIQSGSSDTLQNVFTSSNDLIPRQVLEASQSPAIFGFSSSNSSSPPLSQSSGPSSASSMSEAACTSSLKLNNIINFSMSSNMNTNNSNTPFSSLSGMKSALAIKNESPFFNTNSLDNVLDSVLLQSRNGTASDSISDSFSTLLDNNAFATSTDTFNLEQRRLSNQNQQGLLTTSFSQDSLPLYFQNSFASSDKDALSMSNNGKLSLFNGNTTNNSCTSSITSPIVSAPLFSSSNLLFNEQSIDQRPSNFSGPNVASSSVQLQARFDSHMRTLANEINSTVQLYLHSIQMRKVQLLKHLDHITNTYSMLIAQNKGKNQIPFSRITFSRPDQGFFKLLTTFGLINSPAFAMYCSASGEGLTLTIEGEPTCFLVATRNCLNEEIVIGGENIEVDIQPIETNPHPSNSFMSNHLHIQKNVLDNNNGRYNVTYMIPRGSNLRNIKIIVSINGLPINNSPFYATVKTERLRESWKRILLYGEEGSDPGKFCRPWGIAIARLPLQHDSTHKPVGDNQKDIPIPSKPFYTCNNSNLNKTDYLLIVADRSNNRIQSFKLSTANASATKPNCYSGNNKVEISVLNIFGSGPGTRPGQFDRPAGIAINSNLGQLVVADKDNHRIQVFDLAGNFQFKFGEKGSRPGQFCYPWDIAICNQTSLILVSDTRNRRIQLFTHYGQYLWHCCQPLDSPRGVAFLTPERYIISDFNKHRLLIIDKNDTFINSHNGSNRENDLLNSKYIGFGEGSAWGEFLRPQGLVAIVNKNTTGVPMFMQILCADSRNNRIAIYNSLNRNFEYINEDSTKNDTFSNLNTNNFDRPSGIAMADNILAVVDFGNNRIQIFQKCLV